MNENGAVKSTEKMIRIEIITEDNAEKRRVYVIEGRDIERFLSVAKTKNFNIRRLLCQ